MIETKTLGDAVGVQRGDVIDNSETTVLPSLSNGVITGHFKRGRQDKPFTVASKNYKALLGYDPSNPSYLAVEDAFKRGVSEVAILRVGDSVRKNVALPPPEIVVDFDFAVIRYKWTVLSGSDLDVRVSLKKPDRQSNIVGWDKLRTDNGYLTWNGDNTGNGVESVLLDIKKIVADYPSQEYIEVVLKAFWYSTVGSGDLTIEFASYKGGSMEVSGYDWVNAGGVAVEVKSLDVNTRKATPDRIGEHLATLSFNTVTKTGALTKIAN